MTPNTRNLFRAAFALLTLVLFTGCASSDGGGSVSGGAYYGTGFYDPWFYGGYDYDDPDIIVTPPGNRPSKPPPRPTHPIARPPASAPRPMPMPSIPTAPRVSPRR